MSREYAETRIREALQQSGGNPLKARQRILAWTYEDAKLLQALTRPHLGGIVAYAINRVISKDDHEDEVEEVAESPDILDIDATELGLTILDSLQSRNTALFGREKEAPRMGKRHASKQHMDAILKMANTRIKREDSDE